MTSGTQFHSRLLESGSLSDLGTVDAENPWPGLASFREADHAFFRGREAETDALERLVMRERLTVVYGLSGLGKTSLLKAGLFPRLRRQRVFPVHVRFNYGEDASDFSAQVRETVAREARRARIEVPEMRDGETLWETFHHKDADFWTERSRLAQPLFVFDQFEEVFTLGASRRAEVDAFLTELADLVEGRPPAAVKKRLDADPAAARDFTVNRNHYRVLLCLREDFLPDLEGLRRRIPTLAHNRLRLVRMDGRAAMSVVRQNPDLVSEEVAREVIRFVGAAVAGDDDTPLADLEVEPALLSVVCRELNFQRLARGDRHITSDLLEGSRDEILSNLYERSVADVGPEVRAFIEDRLLTVSGHRDSVALDNALSVPGMTTLAIDRLVDGRLLRVEERDGVFRIELTHDLLTQVIRDSRDRRHARDARAAAEAEREAEQARAEAALKKLRRSRLISALFVVLAVLAIAGAVDGYRGRQEARRVLAESSLREAARLIAADDAGRALAHLAHALEQDSGSAAARGLLLSQLIYRRWPLPRVEVRHPEEILAAAIDPAGSRVVTGSDDGTVRLFSAADGTGLGELTGHDEPVHAVAFSPDGKRLVTASADGTARLWDAASGEEGAPPLDAGEPLDAVAFSPVGDCVAAVSSLMTAVLLWHPESGRVARLEHDDLVRSAAFSHDGKRLVTAAWDGSARIWEVSSCAAAGGATLTLAHDDPLESARFSPDGRRLATLSVADSACRAHLWDAATGQRIGRVAFGDGGTIAATLAFSPDGQRLIATCERAAGLWYVATGDRIAPIQHSEPVTAAVFSPDGLTLVTGSEDGTARLWDAFDGTAAGEPARHRAEVTVARFDDAGRRLLTASRDGTARLWTPPAGGAAVKAFDLAQQLLGAAWGPRGRLFLTAADGGSAQIWDAGNGEATGRPMRHDGVTAAAFSPGGELVVTAGNDGFARVWSAADSRLKLEIEHPQAVNAAAFSPDGRRVVTACSDHLARIWDAATGAEIARMQGHEAAVYVAAFSPDGRVAVTASRDATARIWDAGDGTLIGQPLSHDKARVFSAAFSPDSRHVVTTAFDRQARIWDVAAGALIGEPLRHDGVVVSAAYDAGGRRIVTASLDGAVRLWDPATGTLIGEPLRHDDAVTAAAFSPGGEQLLTASVDGTVRFWPTPAGDAAAAASLATLAEAVGGYRVNDRGTVVRVDDPGAWLRPRVERLSEGDATAADLARELLEPGNGD